MFDDLAARDIVISVRRLGTKTMALLAKGLQLNSQHVTYAYINLIYNLVSVVTWGWSWFTFKNIGC